MTKQKDHILVIGGGQAAAQLISTVRREGFDGALTLVTDEPELPYQRPPLSKEYLAGKFPRERLPLRPEAVYEKAGCRLLRGTRAEAIDRAGKTVRLSDGQEVAFDRLALTTGGRVRRLPVPGGERDGVFYLRTIAYVDRIRAALGPARRIVVIGGGFIGLEAAAVLCEQGRAVTVIEVQDRLMPRVVAPVISDFYHDLHSGHGVAIRTGEVPVEITEGPKGATSGVVLQGGEVLEADMVIVGIGILPNSEPAEAAGLECDNGIRVDACARTSDPDIVAAGDCAVHFNRRYGRWVRLESVQNAMDQAKAAAATLAGRPTPYDEVPWFWSNQYDKRLQMAGLSAGHDHYVVRGRPADGKFSVFYFRDGHLIAVDSINRPGDHMAARRLIAADVAVTPEQAGDETADLKELLAA